MNTKTLFFSLALLFLASFPAEAQKKDRPAATPQEAITFFFDGLSEADESRMRQHLTADFLLLEDGVVWNADSLANAISTLKGADFKRTNTFRYIREDVKKRSAILAYHNRADILYNGRSITIEWLESAELVRQGKGWKIRLMHSTKIDPKAKR